MKKLLTVMLASALILASCSTQTETVETVETPDVVVESVETTPEVETPEVETSEEEIEYARFAVANLSGPTAIGFLNMMEEEEHDYTIFGAPDEVVAAVVKGEIDIASIPANLAATLYNKTEGGISVVAINTLGVIYVVEVTDQIHSIEDLAGQHIYSTGQGSTPEYGLNYILETAGIADQVEVEFKTEHAELVALMSAGQADIGVLPEPYVSAAIAQNPDIHVALDLTEEWDKLDTESTMITGVLIVRNEVIEENKESLDAFLEDYANSIALANSEVEATAELTEKYEILTKEIAEVAIPNCNITYIDGEEMATKLSKYLEVLGEQNITSIGGALPGEDFYYSK
ncbi:MAG: MqnA/MqnD/SBP family protein [Clostridia bacterium]